MAKAFVIRIDSVQVDLQLNQTDLQFTVNLVGVDVPGGYISIGSQVVVDTTTTLAQMASAIAAEVRKQATSQGITVPANSVFLPAYTSA